jgi:hypothetical protein
MTDFLMAIVGLVMIVVGSGIGALVWVAAIKEMKR